MSSNSRFVKQNTELQAMELYHPAFTMHNVDNLKIYTG